MVPRLTSVVTSLIVLGVVLWPLEQLLPVRRQRLLRGELTTDLAYWFLTPFVTRWLTRTALVASMLLLAAAAGIPLDSEHVKAFAANPGRVAQRQPAGIQVLEVLILGDPSVTGRTVRFTVARSAPSMQFIIPPVSSIGFSGTPASGE